jgi:hypothetical protein
MLPIIPLDGSNFVKSLLNKYFSFKNSYIIYIIISIISTIIYLFINYKYSLNNYMIIFLFIYKTYQYIKDFKYIYNRFLLERYLNEYSFKHINTRKGDIDILKLDTYQYFKENKTIIGEKEKLKSIFSKY